MGRLIDTDNLKDRASEYTLNEDEYRRFCEIIDAEPTVFDLDKVVARLEYQKNIWNHDEVADARLVDEKGKAYTMAIKIVKGGGVDDNTD